MLRDAGLDRLRPRLEVPPGGLAASARRRDPCAVCDRDRERLARAGRSRAPSERGATPRRPSSSTRRRCSISSRSARRRSRTASWWSWRPGTGRISSARSRRPSRAGRNSWPSSMPCIASSVRLMIHENWRFRPWYRAMRAEIDSGLIGRPIRLRIAHHDTRALRPDGFAQQPYLATMPRLILMDVGVHLVDTARYLIGEIRTVSATTRPVRAPGTVGEDVATLLSIVRFAGDVPWAWLDPELVHAGLSGQVGVGVRIPTVVEGTDGAVRLLDQRLARAHPPRRPSSGPGPVHLPPDDPRSTSTAARRHRSGISSQGLLTWHPSHETRAADNLQDHGGDLGRLPLGRGRTNRIDLIPAGAVRPSGATDRQPPTRGSPSLARPACRRAGRTC